MHKIGSSGLSARRAVRRSIPLEAPVGSGAPWSSKDAFFALGLPAGRAESPAPFPNSALQVEKVRNTMLLLVRRIELRRRATRAPGQWLYSGKGLVIRAFSFPAGSPHAINALLSSHGGRPWTRGRARFPRMNRNKGRRIALLWARHSWTRGSRCAPKGRPRDLNPQPRLYESRALPLS